jgi:hypothetical protein
MKAAFSALSAAAITTQIYVLCSESLTVACRKSIIVIMFDSPTQVTCIDEWYNRLDRDGIHRVSKGAQMSDAKRDLKTLYFSPQSTFVYFTLFGV